MEARHSRVLERQKSKLDRLCLKTQVAPQTSMADRTNEASLVYTCIEIMVAAQAPMPSALSGSNNSTATTPTAKISSSQVTPATDNITTRLLKNLPSKPLKEAQSNLLTRVLISPLCPVTLIKEIILLLWRMYVLN